MRKLIPGRKVSQPEFLVYLTFYTQQLYFDSYFVLFISPFHALDIFVYIYCLLGCGVKMSHNAQSECGRPCSKHVTQIQWWNPHTLLCGRVCCHLILRAKKLRHRGVKQRAQ